LSDARTILKIQEHFLASTILTHLHFSTEHEYILNVHGRFNARIVFLLRV
jgi:hypothetical protein